MKILLLTLALLSIAAAKPKNRIPPPPPEEGAIPNPEENGRNNQIEIDEPEKDGKFFPGLLGGLGLGGGLPLPYPPIDYPYDEYYDYYDYPPYPLPYPPPPPGIGFPPFGPFGKNTHDKKAPRPHGNKKRRLPAEPAKEEKKEE